MKQIISQQAPAAIGPYSQAIQAGNTLYCSGQIGLDPESGTLQDGLKPQTEQVFQNISKVLAEAGMSYSNVVKTTVFLTDMTYFSTVNNIYQQYFVNPYPARSCVAVKELPKGALVEVECVAIKES